MDNMQMNEEERYKKLVEESGKAIKINLGNAEAHHSLVNLLYNLKRYDEAKEEYEEYEKAINISNFPKAYYKAYYDLGNLLYGLKFDDEAEEKYTQIIKENSNLAKARYILGGAHYNLGNLWAKLNRSDEANNEFEKARELLQVCL